MSEPKLAEVITLRDRSLVDVPDMLRKLADDIEAGKYGEPGSCAVALLANELEIFGFGLHAAGPSIHLLLLSAAHKIQHALVSHGASA